MHIRFLLLALLLTGLRVAQAQTATAPDWLHAQALDCPGDATAAGLLTDAAGNA